MEMQELQKKTDLELREMLGGMVVQLQELRFKAANLQLKEVRQIRVLRKNIARIHTILSERAMAKQAVTTPN